MTALTLRRAVKQTIGTMKVKLSPPDVYDLRLYSTDPSGRAADTTVVNLGQGLKTTRLVCALQKTRQAPQRSPVKIIPQAER